MRNKKFRFGFQLDIPSPTLKEMLCQVRKVENAGFDSIWFPDHILVPPPVRSFVPDAYMTLAVLAVNTSRAMLGTSVTCVHRRNYAVLAHLVSTLDHFSNGRAIFGVGSGESMNLDPFGIEWDSPVSRTVEAIELIIKLWQNDEPFDFKGDFYDLNNGFLQLDTVQKPNPPIFLAANGPRSMGLVGKYYDGWLPAVETPDTYKKHVDLIAKSAKQVGRSIEDIDCGIGIPTVVCDDSGYAYEMVAPSRHTLINLPKKLKEAGYEVPSEYPSNYYLEDLMVKRQDQEKYESAKEFITEEMVRDFYIIGTVDECINRIESYRDAGLDHLIISSADPDFDRTLEYYERDIIPYFQED